MAEKCEQCEQRTESELWSFCISCFLSVRSDNSCMLLTCLYPQALVDPLMMPVVIPIMDFCAKLLSGFPRNKISGVEAVVAAPAAIKVSLSVNEGDSVNPKVDQIQAVQVQTA